MAKHVSLAKELLEWQPPRLGRAWPNKDYVPLHARQEQGRAQKHNQRYTSAMQVLVDGRDHYSHSGAHKEHSAHGGRPRPPFVGTSTGKDGPMDIIYQVKNRAISGHYPRAHEEAHPSLAEVAVRLKAKLRAAIYGRSPDTYRRIFFEDGHCLPLERNEEEFVSGIRHICPSLRDAEAKVLFVLLDPSNHDHVTYDEFQDFWKRTRINAHHQITDEDPQGPAARTPVVAQRSGVGREKNVPWLLAQMEALQNLKSNGR